MIEIENGEIYNYETNTWQTTLEIPYLLGETKKTYQIKSNNPQLLYGKLKEENNILCLLHVKNNNNDNNNDDLTKYIFRLCTQELLYESKELVKMQKEHKQYMIDPFSPVVNIRKHNININFNNIMNYNTNTPTSPSPQSPSHENYEFDKYSYNIFKDKTELKEKIHKKKNELKEFLKLMTTHINNIKTNSILFDKKEEIFYKILCDDIYITYKTIETKKANLYSTARQNSQGRQRTYNITEIEYEDNHVSSLITSPLKRQQTMYGTPPLLTSLTRPSLTPPPLNPVLNRQKRINTSKYNITTLNEYYSTPSQEKIMQSIQKFNYYLSPELSCQTSPTFPNTTFPNTTYPNTTYPKKIINIPDPVPIPTTEELHLYARELELSTQEYLSTLDK